MNEPKYPSSTEIARLMAAALLAADEIGIDSVAIVREVLEAEGVLDKPKESKEPNGNS
jgi:hypothetical protein